MGIKRKQKQDGTYELREGISISETFDFPLGNSPGRLTEILQVQFPTKFPTVTSAKRAVRRHMVILDHKPCKVDDVVKAGQTIQLLDRVAAGKELNPEQSPIKIQVVYEDDSIACLIKPPGIQTQGLSSGGAGGAPTLSSCLKYVLKPTKEEVGLLHRPREAHRLDSVTGGLVLAAKSRKALEIIACSFSERKIKKRYRAIVHGELSQKNGQIDKQLDDKQSITQYSVAEILTAKNEEQKKFSVIDLWPQTGRYHQIRRHLAYIGHPICGDPLFEETGERRGAKRQKVHHIQQNNEDNNKLSTNSAVSTAQNGAQQSETAQSGTKESLQFLSDHSMEGKDDEMYWSDESIDNELKESIRNRLKNKHKSNNLKSQETDDSKISSAEQNLEKNKVDEENKKELESGTNIVEQEETLIGSKIEQKEAEGEGVKIGSQENGQNKEQERVKKDKKEAPIINIHLKSEEIEEDAFQGTVMLWAAGLHFVHPMDGRCFRIDLDEPGYFKKFRKDFAIQ